MKAMVQWQGDVCFLATSETGHQLLLDGPEEAGGQNKGPRPYGARADRFGRLREL